MRQDEEEGWSVVSALSSLPAFRLGAPRLNIIDSGVLSKTTQPQFSSLHVEGSNGWDKFSLGKKLQRIHGPPAKRLFWRTSKCSLITLLSYKLKCPLICVCSTGKDYIYILLRSRKSGVEGSEKELIEKSVWWGPLALCEHTSHTLNACQSSRLLKSHASFNMKPSFRWQKAHTCVSTVPSARPDPAPTGLVLEEQACATMHRKMHVFCFKMCFYNTGSCFKDL